MSWNHEHSGFFVTRMPTETVERLLEWNEAAADQGDAAQSQRDPLIEHLRSACDTDSFREALYLATPVLYREVEGWLDGKEKSLTERALRALARYYVRMATRATPFGLFAMYSLGSISRHTDLSVAADSRRCRRTRLDHSVLAEILRRLREEYSPVDSELLKVAPTLYRFGDRLRYISTDQSAHGIKQLYGLKEVVPDEIVEEVLELATEPTTFGELREALARFSDCSPAESSEFLQELLAEGLLHREFELQAVGEDATERLAGLCARAGATDLGRLMNSLQTELRALDDAGRPVRPETYRGLEEELRYELPSFEGACMFQVDAQLRGAGLVLSERTVQRLGAGVEFLWRTSSHRDNPVTAFCSRFVKRYGASEIPLLEALDEESGVGYLDASRPQTTEPLLENLPFSAVPRRKPTSERDIILLQLLTRALSRNEAEIDLSQEEIAALEESQQRLPLPDSLIVRGSMSASVSSEGEPVLFIEGAYGPPAARLLGRFAASDDELLERIRALMAVEAVNSPDVVLAEIVHVPRDIRHLNVVARPPLRDVRIVVSGAVGNDFASEIPVSELLVRVEDGNAILRWNRTGQQVVPRLSNAHAYAKESLGLYRFLGDLQELHTQAAKWDWGICSLAARLPRVRHGSLVLSRAQWLFRGKEMEQFCDGLVEPRELRQRMQMPRFVEVVAKGLRLVTDLDNPLGRDQLVATGRKNGHLLLTEMFPQPEDLLMKKGDERLVHELIVPFEARRSKRAKLGVRKSAPGGVANGEKVSMTRPANVYPGGEWLYLKLFCSPSATDRLLLEAIHPLVRRLPESSTWFFLRFDNPSPHLRLRFLGEPKRLLEELFPEVSRAVEPFVETGIVWRVQIDTYDREVERFGGPVALNQIEKIFHFDSRAVLECLRVLKSEGMMPERWRLALLGARRLLGDLLPELRDQRFVASELREAFAREFSIRRKMKRAIGALRRRLDRGAPGFPTSAQSSVDRYLARRSAEISGPYSELMQLREQGRLGRPWKQVVAVLLHLHLNRVLRADHRRQELVLFDFLYRRLSKELYLQSTKPGSEG